MVIVAMVAAVEMAAAKATVAGELIVAADLMAMMQMFYQYWRDEKVQGLC